jgi:cytochrome c peroxidase
MSLKAHVVIAWLATAAALSAAAPRRPLGLDLYRPSADGSLVSRAVTDLGRQLFRDRQLSGDCSMACASCHDPSRAFTSDAAVAVGIHGTRGTRNVPTLVNRAWGRSFFWDGRAATLEEQVLQPILDAGELAMSPERVVSVAKTSKYRARFAAAFASNAALQATWVPEPDRGEGPQRSMPVPYRVIDPYRGLTSDDAGTLRKVAFALAAYVRTIQSGDSAYDRYAHGQRAALTPAAARGLELFRGKAGCLGCHAGPLLSDEGFHNTGVAWRTGAVEDEGRGRITGADADRGAFKTPTLREVGRTAPYMHDGSFATLDAVVEYYDSGGAANPGLDTRLRPLGLTTREKSDLVAFLQSLSGHVRDGE